MSETVQQPTVRYIPRKTRIKTEFVKGITATDLFWLGGGGALTFALGASGGGLPAYLIAGVVAIFTGIGVIRNKDGDRVYNMLWIWFKFMAYAKRYNKIPKFGVKSISDIIPYEKIVEGKYIFFGTYFGAVLEVFPIEFGLLDVGRQEMIVGSLANAFRRMNEKQSASIINLERAMLMDKYIDLEIEKYNQLVKNIETGALTEEELEARETIFAERGYQLEYMNENARVFKNNFYYIVYDTDKSALESTIQGIASTLGGGGLRIENRRVQGKDLAVFLKNCYDKNLDERQVKEITEEKLMDWVNPTKAKFTSKKILLNDVPYQGLTVTNYPLEVSNAWGYRLFNMSGCRTTLNFRQIEKQEAEKIIDKAIIEMRTQMENSQKSSYQIERSTQLETITDLLFQIKRGNESVYDCNFHLMCEWDEAKEVKAKLREEGFSFSELSGRQLDVFRSANISRLEALDQYTRGIPTTTVAATFPFISDMLQDERGICIGNNSYPVFVDFFKRSDTRVNSNMIIIGKSGSGKSFCTKSILAHLAADNTKIFILDPEREYVSLTKNLFGNSIDVGNAGKGRFNPFHIYPAMVDEGEDGKEFDDTFESHLRFLESFFRVVMEGIKSDALESLNGLVTAVYRQKGIDRYTDFRQLKPEQFPIFQDLYELAKRFHTNAVDDFSRINYRVLVTYLEKFADGGRFSGLWNGPASIRTNENFVTFDFMTLLANKNNVVADAQMLLVFKYLDGEVIKNRDYNTKFKVRRKIVIVVDEAHVFINEQRPIALDFMFNMAKRIRKYDGMQIVITQNVKDFVGSPAIAKKSAAIINASQYSMIFALAPNDMSDLVTLYKNSGEINKTEQNQITTNARGQCFFISGPMNRTLIQIETSDEMRKIFE
ncbi:MAG: DUF87 domain-containing protein [Christensenellaceae bacterium]|jgi:hypothetical protein|nr:DUF87 domain-containing protein [Christensenellaceae bacterium]